MRKFFLEYPDVQTVSGQLSWSHLCELLIIEDREKRAQKGLKRVDCERIAVAIFTSRIVSSTKRIETLTLKKRKGQSMSFQM